MEEHNGIIFRIGHAEVSGLVFITIVVQCCWSTAFTTGLSGTTLDAASFLIRLYMWYMCTLIGVDVVMLCSWPSPAVLKPRLRMQHQTPGSPVSSLMSPTGRFSPARHAASPDFSPSRYSPANASYIQRIRLRHLNEPAI